MTKEDYDKKLRDIKFTAGMNLDYHQRLMTRFGVADKFVRTLVGILAVFGLVLAIHDRPPWGFWIATASLIVAYILNVVPLANSEKENARLFQLWSDLRKDAELEEIKSSNLGDGAELTKPRIERLLDLIVRENEYHGTQPAPWPRLLKRCEGDELQRATGYRTREEVEKHGRDVPDSPS